MIGVNVKISRLHAENIVVTNESNQYKKIFQGII